jgi:hypothetical protein
VERLRTSFRNYTNIRANAVVKLAKAKPLQDLEIHGLGQTDRLDASGLSPLFLYPITPVIHGFPLRNPALLFAPGSGVGLASAVTGIFVPPSVECIVPSASVEPITSSPADQPIPSATSTDQVVTT